MKVFFCHLLGLLGILNLTMMLFHQAVVHWMGQRNTEVDGGVLKWGYPKAIGVNIKMLIGDLDNLGLPPFEGIFFSTI